ncbi:hypothetical protein ZIOFF_017298 [Zingiber officinale]|uniref:Uncharacterized protein n=1 Tax=Zingiber officinale TaxID=94328 RepID=A0A8J5LP35_ZINOF|nr:hypothetical protein ZIOFF_017298 [Zingiber officinale]
MALWMDAGAYPVSESEKADLEAIAAIKESAAIELKEKGNQFVKMGKKHYKEAIDCYTRAIDQKILNDSEQSVIFANRAQVNLLMGNHRRALTDAEEAIKLCPMNVKGYYRAAKAAFSLNLFSEATSLCQRGLEQMPSNEEMKKLFVQIDLQRQEEENKKTQILEVVAAAKMLSSALENRGLKFGKAQYQELTGVRKPVLDKSGILHWSVILLYAEVMSSDFIEDFLELITFCDEMILKMEKMKSLTFKTCFQKVPSHYHGMRIMLILEMQLNCTIRFASMGTLLSKKEVLKYLLDGTVKSGLDGLFDEDKDLEKELDNRVSFPGNNHGKWIKVNEKKTLLDILRQPDYIIPAIPVFYVVSKKSAFYKDFKAGKWSPP